MFVRRLFSRTLLFSDNAILGYLALLKLLLPLLTSGEFEFHRDELLYIAMGNHLDWGYLEVPPGIAVVAAIVRELLGDSIFAVRFFPALAGAAMVILCGLMARELGGGRFAQVLAAVVFIMSPAFLRSNVLFQPVSFDQFYWTLGAYLVIRLLKKDNLKLWLALGAICGIGLLHKYTMLLFGFGLLVGFIATPERKRLLTPGPWLAAALALLVVLPNLIWQYHRHWPLFEHLSALSRYQLAHVEPAGFVLMQILMCFLAFPVWMIGLGFLLFSGEGKPYRVLGWLYVAVLGVLMLLSGKAYYTLPAYPMLFAAGALAIEKYVRQRQRGWLKVALPAFIILGNAGTLPYGIPILPIEPFQNYARFMAQKFGLSEPLRWESGRLHTLPQDYADMLGWENQAAEAARVYHRLSPSEQSRCAILASNYGQAGAIDYYSSKYRLPKAISYHGSYYLWGPGDATGEILVTIGIDAKDLQPYFSEVQPAAIITHPFARENDVPINVCRNAKMTLQEIWPQLASYRF